VPVSSTAFSVDAPFDVSARKRDRCEAIDAQHLGDVWPFVPWTDAHFDGITRLHGIVSALSEHTPMEEGIARPIEEFYEANAFLRIEPLDDTADRWT
jgi:hypothetical protein